MTGVNQVAASVIAGCAVSCGALVLVAGASKLYRGVRRLDDATAIRRALRMPRRQWRRTELAAGGVECVTGAVVCSGAYPVLGGAGLAALGAVFCVLLGYARLRRAPGGCGCVRWGAAPETAGAVTWRAVARAALVLAAGVAKVAVSAGTAQAPDLDWLAAGILAGAAVLVLLSMRLPVRSPVCGRPLWRGTHATLRALAGHEMFAAMAASAGPFGPVARYRRAGCTDEFWFTAAAGQRSQVVIFRVDHAAPGARLAVHASLRDGRRLDTAWPAQGQGGHHEVPAGL